MPVTNSSAAHYERAFKLMNWGRYPEAIREVQDWIRESPEDALPYAMLAQVHMKAGEFDQALHWAAESLRLDPGQEVAWFVRVNSLYARGDERGFMEAVAEAERIDTGEPQYPYLKFNMYHKKGKLQQAREELDRALYLAPAQSLYLASDSYLRANAGDFEGSRASETAALRANPEHDQTFLYLAWAAEKRGDYKQELAYLKDAVRLDPADAQIRAEYLRSLQKNYWFYRWLLVPAFIRKLRPWQILLLWFAAWLLFRPLIILLIVLYVLSYWTSRILVKVKVFGWGSLFRRIR